MELNDWVLSPGSRNAPITLTFANDSYFNCESVVDERSAAFIALGKSIVTKKATVICCTSGSAPLNYSPAISEAYYQCIPILVITADRPAKWIDNGEGQSINQVNVFSNFCVASHNISSEDELQHIEKVFEEISKNLNQKRKGPIHLNIAFDEPLYQTTENPFKVNLNITDVVSTNECNLTENQIHEWNSYQRILILCGQMTESEGLLFWLKDLNSDPRVVVLTETISNVRDFQFVNCIDRTISRIRLEIDKPLLVVTLGGAIVSKKIKSLIRSLEKLNHWHVDEFGLSINVFNKLSNTFSCPPSSFVRKIVSYNDFTQVSNFKSEWMTASFIAEERHEQFLKEAKWSDLKVFKTIVDTMPEGINLHMGNSSVVRYIQLYNPINSITYYGNRGVSGIDGCTSTAVGVASKSDKINLLISGDLSFVYDVNAFWNNISKSNLKVIIINNNGGGIFRIIPGPQNTGVFEERFEVGNTADIPELCKAHGLEVVSVGEEGALEEALVWLYSKSNSARVIEIITPATINSDILSSYFLSLNK